MGLILHKTVIVIAIKYVRKNYLFQNSIQENSEQH